MTNTGRIVVGIDGGGTYTRAVAVDLRGKVLARVRTGGASPHKNADAEANIKQAIVGSIAQAGAVPSQVAALVAGIAGFDNVSDEEWARRFTDVPGLTCPRQVVNDAVVAHAGALEGRPGIIVIAGTGSLIFGVTNDRRHVRNYDFHHYTPAAARHLAYDAVHHLLAGEACVQDAPLLHSLLAFCQKDSLADLRDWARTGFHSDAMERTRFFGEMAPLITQAAREEIPLAVQICDAAARQLSRGIRLVAGCFDSLDVPVVLIGGVAQSAYIKQAVANALSSTFTPHCYVTEATFSAEVGAALMALNRHGIVVDEAVRNHLHRTLPSYP